MIMRLIILLATLLLPLSSYSKTIKIATAYPEGTLAVKSLRAVAKEVQASTNGEVKIKIYSSGSMGDGDAVKRKMKIGQLHGTLSPSSEWTQAFPAIRVYGQPFYFETNDSALNARDALDSEVLESANQAKDYYLAGIVDGGMSYVLSRQPVSSLEQLKQIKLWLPDDPAIRFYADEFGLDFINLNLGEVGTALQTGALDALIAPPSAAITLRWHTGVKYITPMPVMYSMGVLVLSSKSLKGLSEPNKEILLQVISKHLNKLDENNRRQNSAAFDALTNQGISTTKPTAANILEIKTKAYDVWQKAVKNDWVPEHLFESLESLANP